jgi:diacylglycerol kinase (ATP)
MASRAPRPAAVVTAALLLVLLVGWTWLTFRWGPLQALDQRLLPPQLDPLSGVAQVASAFALLTWPGLEYVVLLGLAGWAQRRKLRQLSIALVLMVVLGWGGSALAKLLIGRPRPAQALELLTATGFSYPSGHLIGATALSVGIGTTFAVTRRSVRAQALWQLGAAALLLAVALDRWLLGAHHVTDLVAGLLQGGLAATLALIIAGVRVPAPHDLVTEIVRSRAVDEEPDRTPRRAAVIYNPSKVVDWVTFRRRSGWRPRWTTRAGR